MHSGSNGKACVTQKDKDNFKYVRSKEVINQIMSRADYFRRQHSTTLNQLNSVPLTPFR